METIIFNWLDEEFQSTTLYTHDDYPRSVFYVKDNVVIGEMDYQNKYFWFHFDHIWKFIEDMFTIEESRVTHMLQQWLHRNEPEQFIVSKLMSGNIPEFLSELKPAIMLKELSILLNSPLKLKEFTPRQDTYLSKIFFKEPDKLKNL